jgi:hypothetical protein
VEEEEHGT